MNEEKKSLGRGLDSLLGERAERSTQGVLEVPLEDLVPGQYQPRNKLTQQVTDELTAHFPDVLFSTVIPRNVRLAEAPSFGKPALKHEPNAKGTLAYLALAGELIDRMEDRGVIAANE